MAPLLAATANRFGQLFATRADDLVLAMELEGGRPPVTASRLITALASLLGVAVVWSAFTPVQEVARSRGSVIPAGDIVVVQHLEGGQAAQILVEDGDIVLQGQPLIRLSPVAAQARLDQLVARRDALVQAMARDRVMVAGGDEVPALAVEQAALLAAERTSVEAQRRVLDAEIQETEARIASVDRQLVEAREAERLAVEERRVQEDYVERGLGTRDRLVRARESAMAATQRVVGLESERAVASEQLLTAEQRRAEFDALAQTQRLQSTADLTAELAVVEAELRDARDRMARLLITAPVGGVVTDLKIKAINSVVGAGEPILQIVPTADRMVVETQVPPRDIGRVALGQDVSVRVDAFDFSAFGALEGVVERISPTTFVTEQGDAFYRVRIGLDRAYFGKAEDGLAVTPGMTVEADIEAGDRSLLAYLLRPITRGWTRSFNER